MEKRKRWNRNKLGLLMRIRKKRALIKRWRTLLTKLDKVTFLLVTDPQLKCRLLARWLFRTLSTIEIFSLIWHRIKIKVKCRIRTSGRSTRKRRRGLTSIMVTNRFNTTLPPRALTILRGLRVMSRKQRNKSRSIESIKLGNSSFLTEHTCQSTRALPKRISATSLWRASTKQGKKGDKTD